MIVANNTETIVLPFYAEIFPITVAEGSTYSFEFKDVHGKKSETIEYTCTKENGYLLLFEGNKPNLIATKGIDIFVNGEDTKEILRIK